jgi:hypothetical protein
MVRSSILAGLVAVAVLSPAHAAVSGPGSAAAIAGASDPVTTTVAWVCGPFRCVWRPGWRGVVPRFAIWGPPRIPGCFYERRRGHWVEICP